MSKTILSVLSSQSRISACESLENQGVQEPEIEISTKDRTVSFEM
jgi:hypothetical protein